MLDLLFREWTCVDAYEVCVQGMDDEPGFYCPTDNTCCRMLSEVDDGCGDGGILGEDGVNGNRNRNHCRHTHEEEPLWGCVASDMGARNATCCTDDVGRTGCPSGYECRRRKDPANLYDCVRSEPSTTTSKHKTTNDPLMRVLPRYRLCRAEESNRKIYGLPIPSSSPPPATTRRSSSYVGNRIRDKERSRALPLVPPAVTEETTGISELAYYSNLGPIDGIESADRHQAMLQSRVEMALVIVHGANRNADDYLCSAKATIELQTRYGVRGSHHNGTVQDRAEVLVVAPYFMPPPQQADISGSSIDSASSSPSPSSFLYWDDKDRDGPWRYGADAAGPVAGVSSFDAMDALVRALAQKLPNLRRIVVAGHSSGGQFVQRWSLLTPPEVWPSGEDSAAVAPLRKQGRQQQTQERLNSTVSIHAVVANPSNYVYFTPQRFSDNHGIDNTETTRAWRRLSVADSSSTTTNNNNSSSGQDAPATDCPEYNRWEWGLDDGGDLDVPYRKRAFSRDDRATIVDRYLRHRSIVYLIGNLDRCSAPGHRASTEGCNSHGLETTCMDELQGKNRYERNARYWASLERYFSSSSSSSLSSSSSAAKSPTDAKERATNTSNTTNTNTETSYSSSSSRFHGHHRIVVPNVGHDHSMMFQSKEGIFAIYDCC